MSSPLINRESRHVLVTGLPDTITEEKLNQFFSGSGRVQKIERCADGWVVSFSDVRSALKAHNAEHRMDTGHSYRLAFYDPASFAKNPISQHCISAIPGGSSSPRNAEGKHRSASPRSLKEMRGQRPSNLLGSKRSSNNNGNNTNQRGEQHPRVKEGRSDSGSSASPCSSGLQGFYIEKIPKNGGDSLRNAIADLFKRHGKLADVQLQDGPAPDERRALVIFNCVTERIDKYAMIMGTRYRVRPAEIIDVQMAYGHKLAEAGAMAASTSRGGEHGEARDMVTVYSDKATRTLYVGGLESSPTDASLRRRFEKFGTILEVDVKNPESPSPFAFLQFADVDSAVRAINAHRQNPTNTKKLKVNFGRYQVSNRLWIGAIPPSAPATYVEQKLRANLEGTKDFFLDPKVHQAIVCFGNSEQATRAHEKIRNGDFTLNNGPEGQQRLSVDYASDKLLNFFIDRKHQSTETYLSPPPNPPPDMPSYSSNSSYRYDHYRDNGRRSSPASYSSRRYERSRSRDRSERSRSRHKKPAKYDRRRNSNDGRRRRRDSSDSSTSRDSSSSSDSSKRSSSGSRSEMSSPAQYRSSKSSRKDDRRDRDRDRKPRRRSASGSPAAEKSDATPSSSHSNHNHNQASLKRSSLIERVETAQERAQSGDSGFSEEQRGVVQVAPASSSTGPLEPPPAPPPLDVETAKPPPPKAPPPREERRPAPPQGPPPTRQIASPGAPIIRRQEKSSPLQSQSHQKPKSPIASASPGAPIRRGERGSIELPPPPREPYHREVSREHRESQREQKDHSRDHLHKQQQLGYHREHREHPQHSQHQPLGGEHGRSHGDQRGEHRGREQQRPHQQPPSHHHGEQRHDQRHQGHHSQPGPSGVRPSQPPPLVHEVVSKRPSFDGHVMRDHYGNDVMNRSEQRQHHLPAPYSYYPGATTRAHGANNFAQKDAVYSFPSVWPFSILQINNPTEIPLEPIPGEKAKDPRKKAKPLKTYGWEVNVPEEFHTWMDVCYVHTEDVPESSRTKKREKFEVISVRKPSSGLGPAGIDRRTSGSSGSHSRSLDDHPPPPLQHHSVSSTSSHSTVSGGHHPGTVGGHPYPPGGHQGHQGGQRRSPSRKSSPPESLKSPFGERRLSDLYSGGGHHQPGGHLGHSYSEDTPGHEEGGKSRHNSTSGPGWMPNTKDVPPPPPAPASRSNSSSSSSRFEARLYQLKEKQKSVQLGLSNAGGTPNRPGPNLQISIPPPGANYPGTPNSAKSSDFSPRMDNQNPRKAATATPSTSRQPPFPPMSAPPPAPSLNFPPNVNLPPPNYPPPPLEPPPPLPQQQPSPVICPAPPPPPLLPLNPHGPSASSLKSPPVTPGSTSSRYGGMHSSAPSPSMSRPSVMDFKSRDPMSSRAPQPPTPSRHPSLSSSQKSSYDRSLDNRSLDRSMDRSMDRSLDRQDSSRFPGPDRSAPIHHRHDSMSALRSPPTVSTPSGSSGSLVARSMSVSEQKKPAKDTSDLIQHLFNKDVAVPSVSSMKSFKIEKKSHSTSAMTSSSGPSTSGLQQQHQQQDKEKHHKKEKEHKQRRKEDGTLETKEERARRKEMERAKKEKKAKKERKEKLERKRSKEGDEGSSKKEKKRKKEKEEKKKRKKKKHRQSSAEEEEEESEEEDASYQKSFMRQQVLADHELALAIAGQSMYDRVKRRSSAATKDDAKKNALQALREKNQKKRRVLMDSSDEEEGSQQNRTEDSSGGEESEPPTLAQAPKSGDSDDSDGEEAREREMSLKMKRKKLKAMKEAKRHRTPSDSDSDAPPPPQEQHHHKKSSKDKKKEKKKKNADMPAVFRNPDIFNANSSEDEPVVREEKKEKKAVSTSDESDHRQPRKVAKMDFHDLFGSDSTSETKKEKKKEKERQREKSPKQHHHHRKRQLSGTGDEFSAKRQKRGSIGSEFSSDAEALAKFREPEADIKSPKAVVEEPPHSYPSTSFASTSQIADAHPTTSRDSDPHASRPRLVTKAAVKVFDPLQQLPSTSSTQPGADDVDSDDSTAHFYPPSRDSTSSGSEEEEEQEPTTSAEDDLHVEVDSKEAVKVEEDVEMKEEGELDDEEEEEDEDDEEAREVERRMTEDAAPTVVETKVEPEPEEEQKEKVKIKEEVPVVVEEEVEEMPVRDEEGEKAALSIIEEPEETTTTEEDQETEKAVLSIFDDSDEEPNYPSNDFDVRGEEVVIEEEPLEISGEQIIEESIIEEPMPEQDEEDEDDVKTEPATSTYIPLGCYAPKQELKIETDSMPPTASFTSPFASPTKKEAPSPQIPVSVPLSISVEPREPTTSSGASSGAGPSAGPGGALASPFASADSLASPVQARTPQSAGNRMSSSSPMMSPAMPAPGVTAQPPVASVLQQQPQQLSPLNVARGEELSLAESRERLARMQEQLKETPDVTQNEAFGRELLRLMTICAKADREERTKKLQEEQQKALLQQQQHPHGQDPLLLKANLNPSLHQQQQQQPQLEKFEQKMPPIWRGKLVIKNLTEVAVQMHIMCGEKDYMMDALGPVTAAERSPKDGQPALRIVQRMRAEGHGLYSLLHRLQKHGATCLCVPIGRSKEEMREHSLLLKNSFSDYFLKKGCAGVVNVNATETTPPSLVYVFPPNEFTDVYMSECAPLLLDKLKLKEADDFSYLFVAIAPQGTPAD